MTKRKNGNRLTARKLAKLRSMYVEVDAQGVPKHSVADIAHAIGVHTGTVTNQTADFPARTKRALKRSPKASVLATKVAVVNHALKQVDNSSPIFGTLGFLLALLDSDPAITRIDVNREKRRATITRVAVEEVGL